MSLLFPLKFFLKWMRIRIRKPASCHRNFARKTRVWIHRGKSALELLFLPLFSYPKMYLSLQISTMWFARSMFACTPRQRLWNRVRTARSRSLHIKIEYKYREIFSDFFFFLYNTLDWPCSHRRNVKEQARNITINNGKNKFWQESNSGLYCWCAGDLFRIQLHRSSPFDYDSPSCGVPLIYFEMVKNIQLCDYDSSGCWLLLLYSISY